MKQLTVSGRTFDLRESLKNDGFRWNPERKAWTRNFADNDEKLDILKNAYEENGLFTEVRSISNPNEKKYFVKQGWIFNLESMQDKVACIGYDVDDGKIQFPIEIAGKDMNSFEDLEAIREEAYELEWKAKSGKVTGKEYSRIREIVTWRVNQRYMTCIASGMSEADAGICFQDM